MIETAKETATKIYGYIKPYEKAIGLVALAAAVDHFVLGGKFTDRFRKIAEVVVTKITESLDRLVDKLHVGIEEAVGLSEEEASATEEEDPSAKA